MALLQSLKKAFPLFRDDGWMNILTGLGDVFSDKRLAARVNTKFLNKETLEALYQCDEMAARVVDRLAEDMMREGFEIKIPDDSGNRAKGILLNLEKFKVSKKIEKALKLSRLYGSSALLIGIQGQDPATPLDLKNVGEVEYLSVLHRHQLKIPAEAIQQDVTQENYGEPEYYLLNSSFKNIPRIHHSRLIRFDGVELTDELMKQNNYWGDSVLCRLYEALLNFNSGHNNVAAIIQDFTQAVFKLSNLSDIIAQGPEGEKILQERLKLISMKMSVLNAIVLQNDESFERKTTSVAGVSDLINILKERFIGGTDMPHTILFGESPSGLGATGESEKIDWYDHVKNKQKSLLLPALKKLLDIFFSQKLGPVHGIIPDYTIEFRPLWQMDDKEKVDIRKAQAEIDEKYIDVGVYDADEVAQSRFGSGGYSLETVIDFNGRKKFEELSKGEENV